MWHNLTNLRLSVPCAVVAFIVWLLLGEDIVLMLRPFLGIHADVVAPVGIVVTFLLVLAFIGGSPKPRRKVAVAPFRCTCRRDPAHLVGHTLMRAYIERRIRGGETILPVMQYALVGLAGPIAHGYIHNLRIPKKDPDMQLVKRKLAEADLLFQFDEIMKEARSIMISLPMEESYRRLVNYGEGRPGLLDAADESGMISGAYDSDRHFPFIDR